MTCLQDLARSQQRTGFSVQAEVIIDDEVWNLEEDVWEPFPVAPLR